MKYLRKMMWFIARKLCLYTLSLSLAVCGFFICMNLGTAYVLVSEGMEKRVAVALTREDAARLNEYFAVDFLNADPLLAIAFSENTPYLYYSISDFTYKLSFEKLWGWPWENYIECTVVERVTDITGKRKADYADLVQSTKPPSWSAGRYRVGLARVQGEWRIVSMKQIGELPNV